mmetsp:Transcript_24170/g.62278  ORF Transcript_24170/g.62278 Transcript_24170/m.62278 type:complete len:120 (-) Transcript_24170:235-594(-)
MKLFLATLLALVVGTQAFGTFHKDCGCIGNGGRKVSPDATLHGGMVHPAYGNSCFAWDMAEKDCMEGGASYGADWCDDAWCFVPKGCYDDEGESVVFGDALYYSYSACGSVDAFTDTVS